MKDKCTEERFFTDIKDHEMIVRKDEGVYRHLTFKRPNSNTYRFDLVTWPGFLAFTGDMGDQIFSRLDDMFVFFRNGKDLDERGVLGINPCYWGEKLKAKSIYGGYDEYDSDKFMEIVQEDFFNHFETKEGEDENIDYIWQEVKEDALLHSEHEYQAHVWARYFKCKGFYFSDFWEHDLKSHTFYYIWSLYAIVWGIQQYDHK